MEEIRVRSWGELQERLYENSWREPLGRFRSTYAFRGVSRVGHALRTSLSRLGPRGAEQETHILRNFRKYAHRDSVPGDSVWNWLALAQHHGLPTRMLDWTFSPYVALHFVTENPETYGEDGVVWCMDYAGAHRALPESLCAILQKEGSEVFTGEMLSDAAGTLAEFDALAPEPFVVFFEPPSLDERIVNQFALFSLLSSPTAQLADWLAGREETARRIVIPAALKWEVRDKLDQANVTERVLFPGLDGLSRWLRRYYLPIEGCENG
jgi:hypothetical protein